MILPKRFLTSGDNCLGVRAQGSNGETVRSESDNTIDIIEANLVGSNADRLSKYSQGGSQRDFVVEFGSYKQLSTARLYQNETNCIPSIDPDP